jgi:hypothetical protein
MDRSSAHAFVNHLLVYALVSLGCAGSVGVGMVWMRHQISLVANDNKTLEGRLAATERRIEESTAAIAAEQNPAVLTQRNAAWRLGLVPPQQGQVLDVAEDPMVKLDQKHNRGIFSDRPEVVSFRVALQP